MLEMLGWWCVINHFLLGYLSFQFHEIVCSFLRLFYLPLLVRAYFFFVEFSLVFYFCHFFLHVSHLQLQVFVYLDQSKIFSFCQLALAFQFQPLQFTLYSLTHTGPFCYLYPSLSLLSLFGWCEFSFSIGLWIYPYESVDWRLEGIVGRWCMLFCIFDEEPRGNVLFAIFSTFRTGVAVAACEPSEWFLQVGPACRGGGVGLTAVGAEGGFRHLGLCLHIILIQLKGRQQILSGKRGQREERQREGWGIR